MMTSVTVTTQHDEIFRRLEAQSLIRPMMDVEG
jgi:hypothetical protein